MDYRGRVVLRGNDSLLVNSIDVNGIFECTELGDLLKDSRVCYTVDPIVETIYDTGDEIVNYDRFSYLDYNIFPFIDEIRSVIGIKGIDELGYLFIIESKCYKYIVEVLFGEIFCTRLRGMYIDLLEGMSRDVKWKNLELANYCSDLDIGDRKLYKIGYKVSDVYMSVLERMFYKIPCGSVVRLPLLTGRSGEGVCVSVYNGLEYVINTIKMYENGITSSGKISPEDVYCCMRDSYDYPCAHFNEEELDKLCGILELNGYESIVPEVIKYNGIKSNFNVPDSGDYVCIRDYNCDRTYTVNLLRVYDIKSVNGITLYSELRMYDLCKGSNYTVLCSSFSREDCEQLQKLKYANLIRGRLLRLKSFRYELTYIEDAFDSVYVRYVIRGNKEIFSARYWKENRTWEYIKSSEIGDDNDYLNVLLQILDRTASISKYTPNRFSVYSVKDNKILLDNSTCIGSTGRFQNCRNLVSNAEGIEFLIVKWVSNIRDIMWVFNKKEKTLVRL